jgi:cytochrome c oxidase subunit 2
MTRTGTIIAVGYLTLVVVGVLIALWVWATTRRPRPIDATRIAERESTWAVIVLVALGALVLGTIFFTPYGRSAGAGAQRVDVAAFQFAWTVEPSTVRAGDPVEFFLTSAEVSHAMGVYDEDGRLVVQVNALPGETQRLVHTFARPGVYEILCLEFCGVGHHLMETTLEVSE